ncbi:transglutaminaseTgpA domain-containing protein [Synoicihabitans lomoniglobus]|uniref:TransglutaminaseTgpA domain-containing protein n=1 Tax=Synoicihabitans lomoniglobus TaxID=2909285 RepID=A0AAF0CMN3_9BACT|nr:transglutaminaseTgpA domain-containing protein [Opitutaceae bacterium LMO-M01]WED63531.1 transglutaminaseTgpA domain-containing protein [Opitutaceae bacterium LMO-M01]
MDKKRPQLNSDDLGRLRWWLGAVLALLSVVTVFFMEIDAWLHMPVVAVAAIAALVKPTWPGQVPAWMHRAAFPLIVVMFVVDLALTREPLPALIRLDLTLIFYRLVTYRQRRDDLQLVLLGLFLVIVAGVITVSLSFVLQLLAFTSCALVMLLAVTLEHADGVSPPPVPPRVVPSWARISWRTHRQKLRAATDWRLATLGVVGFGAMVVLSGLLFLAIPRFDMQSSLFIDRLITRTTRTGFSDNIQFGDVTSITEDNSLAFSVDLTDPSVMPRVPYWRMVVLDEYTGAGFKMSDEFRRDLNGYRPLRSELNGRGIFWTRAPTWTIYMEPAVSRYLPLLGNFYSIRFTEPQTFTMSEELRIVALQRDPPKMFAFRTWSMDTGDTLKDATFTLKRRDGRLSGSDFTALPENAVTRSRLTTILGDIAPPAHTDATSFAQHVVKWLSEVHPYALSSAVPPGEGDTLVRWLDSEASGHCEFFAGSFVLLARAAGYPARLVTGFRGGTWNDFSGSFTVRNANAHAWCEIFDDASGSWIRVDPTPGNQGLATTGIDPTTGAALARDRDNSWKARLESLRVFWYRRIVNFDLDSQEAILSSTTKFFRESREMLVEWADEKANAVRTWVQRPWNLDRFLQLAGALIGVGLLVWVWRQYGRAWWLRLRRSTARVDQDPVRREAGRWLQRATKRTGFVWPPETELALLRLRFGNSDTWPEPVKVFRSAKTALRNA